MEHILENFPYIKNRIINFTDDEWFVIKMSYGDDIIALDIDVPEDSNFISFKDGVLFKMFELSVRTTLVSGKTKPTYVLATGVKATKHTQILSDNYCVFFSDSYAYGSFEPTNHNILFMYQFENNADNFNNFWRLSPEDECYAVAGKL